MHTNLTYLYVHTTEVNKSCITDKSAKTSKYKTAAVGIVGCFGSCYTTGPVSNVRALESNIENCTDKIKMVCA